MKRRFLPFNIQRFAEGGEGGQSGAGENGGQGGEPNGNAGNGGSNEPPKTFTQDQLDAILKDRLERERGKYKDYDDLKTKAAEFDKIKTSQMTELEKAQADAKTAAEKLAAYESEIATMKLNQSRSELAAKYGIPPEFASRLNGNTPEAIEEDAKAMKQLLGKAGATPPVGGGANPAGANNGPTNFLNASQEDLRKELAKMGIRI